MPPVAGTGRVMAALMVALTSSSSCLAAGVTPIVGATATLAEIQIGLCSPADHIVHALDLRPRGKPITVWQFDDDALTLLEHRLRLRLRVAVDGSSELAVKATDQDCDSLDAEHVPKGEGKCEYDVYAASAAGAVSVTRRLSAMSTSDLLDGRLTPAQALSLSQVRYLREAVRFWPLPEIRKLGPMQVQRYRSKEGVYDVDISRLPDDARSAEISRKVPRADAARAMRVLEDDLRKAGVAMCDEQSSPAASKLRALVR